MQEIWTQHTAWMLAFLTVLTFADLLSGAGSWDIALFGNSSKYLSAGRGFSPQLAQIGPVLATAIILLVFPLWGGTNSLTLSPNSTTVIQSRVSVKTSLYRKSE